jgi:hypothetical protein
MVFARSSSCGDCDPFWLRQADLPASFVPSTGLVTIREGLQSLAASPEAPNTVTASEMSDRRMRERPVA